MYDTLVCFQRMMMLVPMKSQLTMFALTLMLIRGVSVHQAKAKLRVAGEGEERRTQSWRACWRIRCFLWFEPIKNHQSGFTNSYVG